MAAYAIDIPGNTWVLTTLPTDVPLSTTFSDKSVYVWEYLSDVITTEAQTMPDTSSTESDNWTMYTETSSFVPQVGKGYWVKNKDSGGFTVNVSNNPTYSLFTGSEFGTPTLLGTEVDVDLEVHLMALEEKVVVYWYEDSLWKANSNNESSIVKLEKDGITIKPTMPKGSGYWILPVNFPSCISYDAYADTTSIRLIGSVSSVTASGVVSNYDVNNGIVGIEIDSDAYSCVSVVGFDSRRPISTTYSVNVTKNSTYTDNIEVYFSADDFIDTTTKDRIIDKHHGSLAISAFTINLVYEKSTSNSSDKTIVAMYGIDSRTPSNTTTPNMIQDFTALSNNKFNISKVRIECTDVYIDRFFKLVFTEEGAANNIISCTISKIEVIETQNLKGVETYYGQYTSLNPLCNKVATYYRNPATSLECAVHLATSIKYNNSGGIIIPANSVDYPITNTYNSVCYGVELYNLEGTTLTSVDYSKLAYKVSNDKNTIYITNYTSDAIGVLVNFIT